LPLFYCRWGACFHKIGALPTSSQVDVDAGPPGPTMRFAITILIGAALLASSAAAQTGGNAIPTTTLSLTISLGTATPGGGFPLYGNAFAQAMNAADPQATIVPRNTKGSNENIPLLEKGELDPAMVEDGRVAALWGAGIGWPGFTAVASSASGARFIAPSAEEITRIRAKHAFLKPLTVPGGSYPKQSEPIASLGSWSFVLTREDLPDDVAYRLAKTLHGVEATF